MTTLTHSDLSALGYRVVDGKAVRVTVRMTAPASAGPRYRSKWEAERAWWLNTLKRAGGLRDWRYEPLRLRIADGAFYKPDFLVHEADGTLTLEEVKGFWRESSLVRFKVARTMYPMFHFRAVTKRNGVWVDAMEGHR